MNEPELRPLYHVRLGWRQPVTARMGKVRRVENTRQATADRVIAIALRIAQYIDPTVIGMHSIRFSDVPRDELGRTATEADFRARRARKSLADDGPGPAAGPNAAQ